MGERHRDGLTNIERANKRLNIFMAKLIYLGCVCEEGRAGVSRVQAQLKNKKIKKHSFGHPVLLWPICILSKEKRL